jgi:hypothetical protein
VNFPHFWWIIAGTPPPVPPVALGPFPTRFLVGATWPLDKFGTIINLCGNLPNVTVEITFSARTRTRTRTIVNAPQLQPLTSELLRCVHLASLFLAKLGTVKNPFGSLPNVTVEITFTARTIVNAVELQPLSSELLSFDIYVHLASLTLG